MPRHGTCRGSTLHSPRSALLAASALLAPSGPAALSPPPGPRALGCWPGCMPLSSRVLAKSHALDTLGIICAATWNGDVHRIAVITLLMATLKTHSINMDHSEGPSEEPVSFKVYPQHQYKPVRRAKGGIGQLQGLTRPGFGR